MIPGDASISRMFLLLGKHFECDPDSSCERDIRGSTDEVTSEIVQYPH